MSHLAQPSNENEELTPDLAPSIREFPLGEYPEEMESIHEAIGRANSNACPANKSTFIYDESTGSAFAASCDRWSCSVCSRKKVALWSKLIEDGLRIAIELDDSYQHFVLEPSDDRIDPQILKSASRKLLDALKPRYQYRDHALAVEIGPSRGPVLNLVTIGGTPVVKGTIGDFAEQAGFHPDVEMPRVSRTPSGALDLGERITASSIQVARWAKDHHVRAYHPISLSRSWRPYGFTEAKQRLFKDLDTSGSGGPYFRVRVDSSERVVAIAALSRFEKES